MTQSWPEVAFCDLYALPSRNGLMRPSKVRGEGYKMVNMGELYKFDRINKQRMELVLMNPREVMAFSLKRGDLLFARQSLKLEGVGKVSIVEQLSEIITFESHLIRVRLKDDVVDPYFYYEYFRSSAGKSRVLSIATQVAAAGIRASELATLKVPLPPLHTQRKIVAILSAYDDLIENNTRRVQVLEQMARDLYREWFVEFRFPGHETAEFVEDEHGRSPKGWLKTTLGQRARILMGQAPKSEFYNKTGDGLPFHQGVGTFGKHYPKHDTHCTELARVAKEGDILFSVRAPVGRTNTADRALVVGRGLSAIRHIEDAQVFALLQLNDRIKEDSVGNGAIFKAVTKSDVHGIEWLEPPAELLSEFERHASTLWKQLTNLTVKNANLRRTRDFLLPKLVSGELDVSALDVRGPGLEPVGEVETLEGAVA